MGEIGSGLGRKEQQNVSGVEAGRKNRKEWTSRMCVSGKVVNPMCVLEEMIYLGLSWCLALDLGLGQKKWL